MSQKKVDYKEFLFGLLFSRTMVELTYCIKRKTCEKLLIIRSLG